MARAVVPNVPLHITHRGNRSGPVFFDDWDRGAYLEELARQAEGFELDIWAYCLMRNHVHLIVVPRRAESAAKAIGFAHQEHARRVNLGRGWDGHLWGNRYFSSLLDERHLWCAVRYVELNPVRAGLVAHAEDYPWSSAAAHGGRRTDALLSYTRPFPGIVGDWLGWLGEGTDPAAEAILREHCRTGRPCGSAEFVQALETKLGRSLTPRRRGRTREVAEEIRDS
jgi:putative transposase